MKKVFLLLSFLFATFSSSCMNHLSDVDCHIKFIVSGNKHETHMNTGDASIWWGEPRPLGEFDFSVDIYDSGSFAILQFKIFKQSQNGDRSLIARQKIQANWDMLHREMIFYLDIDNKTQKSFVLEVTATRKQQSEVLTN